MAAFRKLRIVIMDDSPGSTRMFTSPYAAHRTVVCAGLATAMVFAIGGCRQTGHRGAFSNRYLTSCTTDAGASDVPGPAMPEPLVSEPLVSEPLVSEPSVSDPVVSEPAQPETPQSDYDSDGPPSGDPDATVTVTGETVLLTTEEASAMIREAGGTLRPNADGTIVEMDLSFSNITSEQITALSAFPEIRELDLTGTELHDDAMTTLTGLSNLQSLKLKGTNITNDGLIALSQLKTLILLDASNTAVSDDGLISAPEWTQLRYLSLNNTRVSDAGIMQLQSLRSLKGLSLINTAVTADGVGSLKTLLPDCLIVAQTDPGVSQIHGLDSLRDLPLSGRLFTSPAITGCDAQLEQLIQLASQQPQLAVHLSSIYSSCGQWEEAGRILEMAVVSDHNDPAIQFCFGEALARSGQAEAALEHFELSVGDAAARYNVGLIVYENTLEECEIYFTQAVAADPSLQVAQSRLTDIRRELAVLRQQQRPYSATVSDEWPLQVVPARSAPPVREAALTRFPSSR